MHFTPDEKTIVNLLTLHFPTEVNVFKDITDSDWQTLEKESDPKLINKEIHVLNFLFKLNKSITPIYNALPGLMIDYLNFKIKNQSIADFLIKNKNRYNQIPTKKLIEPNLNYSLKNINQIRQQITTFAIFCEIKILLAIIDICLAHKPELLFQKSDGLGWLFEIDNNFFKKLINKEPVFLQSWAFIYRIKFLSNLWSNKGLKISDLINPARNIKGKNDRDYLRRALFFCFLFEKQIFKKLTYKEIMHIFKELNICDVNEQTFKDEFYKLKRIKKVDFLP